MDWISVKDRLPDEAEFVLVWGSHAMPWLVQIIEGQFTDVEDGEWLTGVTHWMPLPEPPKEG